MDKEKERKQDLSEPQEEALEQHVREMLDLNEPDAEQATETPVKDTKKSTKIAITHDDGAPEVKPDEPIKKTAKKSIAVSHADDEPEVVPEAPAPEVSAESEVPIEVVATAPLVPKTTKKPTKVAITHFDDSEPEPDQPEATPEEVAESTEPEVEEPAPEPESTPESEPEQSEESPLEPEIESQATEQAINEIIATESDELIAAKDDKIADATLTARPAKKTRKSLFKTSGFWWTVAFLCMAAIVAIVVVPVARYTVLNAVGVRSSASVVVIDQSTQQPLKNVTVTLAGQKVTTDNTGKAAFQKLRLGPTELIAEKHAFASSQRSQTIGWGSNPLDDITIKPTGSQYSFTVTDMLSGKPISTAAATYNDFDANADNKGVITLTLDDQTGDKVKIQIKAAGYRDETIDVSLSSKQNIVVKLVPAHKVAFVSKRSGTYDTYTMDADGKNEKVVLKGTGNEQSNLTFAPHPTEDVAVLVASRTGEHGSDGGLLTDVTFVNLADGSTKKVTQSSSIRVIDWIGTRFIYVQTTVGAKSDDPARDKLMSYDYVSGDNRQLASSNYFNDIVSASGKIYYAPSSAYQNGVNLGMFAVQADGSGKQAVFNQEIWSISRTGYDHFVLAVQQDWYDYIVGGGQPTKLNGQPSNSTARQYTDSPDAKNSVWLDTRDGKGTILLYDTASKSEKVLYAQAGIKGPIRWVGNNAFVYRVASSKETADYIISINGGDPKKLADVTDSKGVDRYSY